MRLIPVLFAVAISSGAALAAGGVLAPIPNPIPNIPLPRPRPAPAVALPEPPAAPASWLPADPFAGLGIDPATITSAPTACDTRLAHIATIKLMPRLIGPGACGGHDLVRIAAIRLLDNTEVSVRPAALLTCPMAESVAGWVREAVAPALAKAGGNEAAGTKAGGKLRGAHLARLENYDSYECRTRNRIPGAKLSEHAHGNALDVRAFTLADGRRFDLTDPKVNKAMRIAWRDAACRRFTTVLGPGERYHSGHVHLDDIVRHNGYRICEWQVLTSAPKAPVPLPRPRPAAVSPAAAPATKGSTF
ncbi:MAG: extensin family protein [Pseudolabrys sp.]